MPGLFAFRTATRSSVDGHPLVPGTFVSRTGTRSRVTEPRIRTYKHDPQKFLKSEPIFIYDRNEDLQLILTDDGIPYRDGWLPEQLNGELKLEFTVLASSPAVAAIENDGRAVTRGPDGEFMEFIIRTIEDADSDGTFKTVTAEGGDYELIDEFLYSYVQASVDLPTALRAILQGTRWQVGQIENWWDMRSVSLKYMTVKEAVVELIKQFGGEVRYRVEIRGNKIVSRYIDVYKKRGVKIGRRFEAGKDIISTSRVLDSINVKTALHGLGAADEQGNRLTFASVEWSKENGDPVDKPLGQTWVGDPDALNKWGYQRGQRHKKGYYDGQEEDPAELLLNTWNELQKLTKLNETYDISVVNLGEQLGYEHERVRLGDSCYVVNRNIYPHMEAEVSIIEYRHNLNDRRLSEVTLGDFRNAYDLAGRFNSVEKDVNDNQGSWSKKPTTEEVKNEAQKAIEEAQKRIDQAKLELEESLQRIEQGKIDLADAEQAIQRAISSPQSYVGYFDGDIAARSITLWEEVIAQNARFTGTILGDTLTVMNADIEKGNIIDANIRNARITGQLDSVNGTFVGDLVGGRILSGSTIDVTTDLRVGNNIYLGEMFTGRKRIIFNEWASISAADDNITIGGTTLRLDTNMGTVELIKASYGGALGFYYSTGYYSKIYQDNYDRHRLKLETGNHGSGANIWMDPNGNIYFRYGSTNRHVFYSTGVKDGGSIEIDDVTYGMSPIDSPQTLISDLITGVPVSGRSVIYLHPIYAKAIEGYAVFPNNPAVRVIEKHADRFVVEGEGITDFMLYGTRLGYQGTYFTDLTKMSADMAAEKEQANGPV